MPDNSVAHQHHATFEGIRHTDEEGNAFWLARPLAKVLDYSEYRHFLPVVERAREACRNSGQPVADASCPMCASRVTCLLPDRP